MAAESSEQLYFLLVLAVVGHTCFSLRCMRETKRICPDWPDKKKKRVNSFNLEYIQWKFPPKQKPSSSGSHEIWTFGTRFEKTMAKKKVKSSGEKWWEDQIIRLWVAMLIGFLTAVSKAFWFKFSEIKQNGPWCKFWLNWGLDCVSM